MIKDESYVSATMKQKLIF